MLKTAEDLGSSVPSQVLGRVVLGDLPRISALRASQLRDCLRLAAGLLHAHLPGWRFIPPAGGQSLWLQLPAGEAGSFTQAALGRGVAVIPGPQLSPDGGFTDYIRLQFLQPLEVLELGIRRLAAAWDDHTTSSSRDLGVIA
jgi:DNA-binding transcriptional MocR family regulator